MDIKFYNKSCCSTKVVEEEMFKKALNAVGKTATIEIINESEKADAAGMPELPALLINGELVLSGYVPSDKELKKLFK